MYCKNFFLFAMVLSAMVYFSPAEARDGRGGYRGEGGRELYPGGGMESEHRERDYMYQDHRGYGGAGAAYEAGQRRGYNYGSQSSAQYMPQYSTMPPPQQQQQQPAQPYPYYEQPYQPRM